ncbi:MAG: signal peptidase II [Bacillota bacterium]
MNKRTLIQSLSLVIAVIVLDQLSKLWIIQAIPYESSPPSDYGYTLIDNFLIITHHHNYGASWGLFQGQTLFFMVVTLIALAAFIFFAKDMDFKEKPVYSLGLSLLIGGTIGNFIDRIRLGYVVDFIDTYIFGYDFPIFNVADAALTVGMVFFAFDILILESARLRSNADGKNV